MVFSDYGVDKYDIGAGFGHFGIAVEDVRFCSDLLEICVYLMRLYNSVLIVLF